LKLLSGDKNVVEPYHTTPITTQNYILGLESLLNHYARLSWN